MDMVRLSQPFVLVFRAAVHQQEDASGRDLLRLRQKKRLCFLINPMEVLADKNEGLIQALLREKAHDRGKGSAASNLTVELLERRVCFLNPKEREKIWQRVFQTTIEHQHFTGNFRSPSPFLILHGGYSV